MLSSFHGIASLTDEYKAFTEVLLSETLKKTEFDTHCESTRETLAKLKLDKDKVAELYSSFFRPALKRYSFESSHVFFSQNAKFAVSVHLKDPKKAILCKVFEENMRLEEIGVVFECSKVISSVKFCSDSSYVVISSEAKCVAVSTLSSRVIFAIEASDLDSRNPQKSISNPHLITSANNIHVVPYLTETSLQGEDCVWFDLLDGKILLLDIRKWNKDPHFSLRKLQIELKNWAEFAGEKQLDQVRLFAINSFVVFLRDKHLEVYLLELKLDLDEIVNEKIVIDFVVTAKQSMNLNRKIAPMQASQISRHRVLVTSSKENQIEEYVSLEYDENSGFVVSQLLEVQSNMASQVSAFYGLKYLIMVDSQYYKGKKTRLMKIFIKSAEGYELFAVLNPFEEKVRAGNITLQLTSDQKHLMVSLQTQESGTIVSFIKAPFPDVLTCTACIPKKVKDFTDGTTQTGVQIKQIDCSFDELRIEFDREPKCITSQSELEDFGILSLQNNTLLRSMSLFNPSTMKFFKTLSFQNSLLAHFPLHYPCKIQHQNMMLLTSQKQVVKDGVSVMQHDKVYSLDYQTGHVSLISDSYESISIDGHYIFSRDEMQATIIMKEVLTGKQLDLQMNTVNKRFDVIGGKIICWNRARNLGANSIKILSFQDDRIKLEFETSEKEDLGTHPIFARKRELMLLILREEFVLIKLREMKVFKLRIPSEIDAGADIEAVTVSMDEKTASFVYKAYLDVMIYVLHLEENLTITAVLPPKNTKDMVMVGAESVYLMTKDRKYNLEPTTLRFFPLSNSAYHSTVNVEISRFRSLEEANFGNQGRKRYILSGDTVEFIRVENIRVSGISYKHFSTTSFLVKYKIAFCDPSLYCMEMIFQQVRIYFTAESSVKKRSIIDNIISIIKTIRPQIIEMQQVYTAIIYHLDNTYAMRKYIEFVGIEELVTRDQILTIFYLNPKMLSGKEIVAALKRFAETHKRIPAFDEGSMVEFVLRKDKKTSRDDLTKDILKLLIFAPTEIVVHGNLISSKKNFLPLKSDLQDTSPGSKFQTYPRLCRPLLQSDPHKVNSYRVYESKIKLDLSNGSLFSLALFDMIVNASDEDIIERYSVLIYHKWEKIFNYALVYSVLFWLMTVLACLFLGGVVQKRLLGVIIIVINGLFIFFEFKKLLSKPKVFLVTPRNYLDVALHTASILVSIIIMIKMDSLETLVTNWIRLATIMLLCVRSISFMRVFGPLRYIIRMLYEVLAGLPPFIVVLLSVIFMWAFAWSLNPVLDEEYGEDKPLGYGHALQVAFGILIDMKPGGEHAELEPLQFVFVVIGHCLIIVTMLNFLIAQIVHTFEESYEGKVLHDVKELLGFISDFDIFMINEGKPEPGRNRGSKYLTLVSEEKDDQLTDIQKVMREELKKLEMKVEAVQKHLSKDIQDLNAKLDSKLSVLVKVLDPEGTAQKQVVKEEALRYFSKRPTLMVDELEPSTPMLKYNKSK